MPIYVPGAGNANGNCFHDGQITPFRVTPGSACSTVTNTQNRRELGFLNPAFSNEIGRMAVVVNGGTQNYNGMLLSVQHRPSQGINLNGNYTWSHCIGDYQARSSNGFGTSVDHTYQDRNNRRRDRGNCEIDQRHSFNLTAVAETPRFANRTLNLLGSGWRGFRCKRRWWCRSVPLRYKQPTPGPGFNERISRHIRTARYSMAQSGGVRTAGFGNSWKSGPRHSQAADSVAIRCRPLADIPFPRNPEYGVSSRSV